MREIPDKSINASEALAQPLTGSLGCEKLTGTFHLDAHCSSVHLHVKLDIRNVHQMTWQ